jgi:hypothetical protein
MDGSIKKHTHQPFTPPTTRISSPKMHMHDTPEKSANLAIYKPHRALHMENFEESTDKFHFIKEPSVSPRQRSLPSFSSCTNSGLKMLADAAELYDINMLVKAAQTNNINSFSDEREAMRFCLRTPTDNTCRIGVRKRKAEDADGTIFDVYSTLPNKNFRKDDFPEDFDLIKAYAPCIVARHASKNPYLLVDMGTPGIDHTVHKKGAIRDTYTLPDKKKLRLYHHTCTYLDQSPCINCQHPEYHARCLAGEEFYAIMEK